MLFKRFLLAGALTVWSFAAFAADPVEIVGFGDSLMAGYELGPGEGFTDRLAAALAAKGVSATVINAGVSGDTSSGGVERLDWSVPDTADIVILELGANDMLRGIAPDVTRANLDQMIVKLKQRRIAVILAGMRAAPSMGPDFQAKFDPIYPELAAAHGVPLYPFFLDGVATRTDLLLKDGLHPNARGVDAMVAGMLPVVLEAIASRR